MKKIIDVSAFESPQLEAYLRARPTNYAILTDYAGIETFQRDGVENIRRAFRLLAAFPDQVIVLEPTHVISRLRPRSKGIQGRLIDKESTASFRQFVVLLNSANDAHAANVLRQIEDRRRKAKAQLDIFMADAEKLSDRENGIFAIGLGYSPAVLAAIRSRARLPPNFHRDVAGHVVQITRATMDKLFPGDETKVDNVLYSFPFRFSLAMYCMNLFWTATGDVTTAPSKKVRNDATDMTYVAYATFFDGVITDDSKLAAAYDLTRGFLGRVFAMS